MSYILDALKKSEQQRAALNIPPEAPAPPRQPVSAMPRLRLSLVILLVLLTAGWFIARLQTPDNQQSSPAVSTQMTAKPVISEQTGSERSIAKQDASHHVVSQQTTTGQTASVQAVASAPITAPAASVLQPLPGEIEKRSHTITKTTAKPPIQNKVRPEQPDISAKSSLGHAPVSRSEAKVVPIFKPITPTSPVSRSTGRFPDIDTDTSQAAPANADIRSLSELPVSVQQSLPSINIEGHIYDDRPARRMVIVNGNIRREKQPIGNGLRLEEITPDGVILSYQGNVFHMGVFER
ncbi:MAG: general secretion pathway protein GspB [Mariprofundus sp.]|nr:general secretion pathway protein GspB [Mariprofundus sp.]